MRIASFFVSLAIASTSIAQCIGWFPAPWAPLRPDPTGFHFVEKSLILDLANDGPSQVVLLNVGAGSHSGSLDPGPDVYIDRGNGWERFGTCTRSVSFEASGGQVAVFRGQIVLAGLFDFVNGIAASNIAVWDGTTWHPLGAGLPSMVAAIAVHGDEIFASGDFGIRRWNGLVWVDSSTLRFPDNSTLQIQTPMFRKYLGDLVAPFAQLAVSRWIEDHWEIVFNEYGGTSNGVNSMEVIGNRITFGCHYTIGYQGPTLAYFDGTYHELCLLCTPVGTGDGSVYSPVDINGDGVLDFLGSAFVDSMSEAVMSLGPSGDFIPSTFPSFPNTTSNNYCLIKGPADVYSRGYQFRSGYPYFNFGPRNQSITHPNRDAIFSSTVTNVPQDVNYTWMHNSIPLEDGPTPHGSVISGAHTSHLTVHAPTPLDAGAYSLTVENPGCQTASSPAAYLSVCLADFNSDAVADFFDYLDFVQAFADNSSAADFNADGITDFFDYLDFVAAFSVGC